MADTTYAKLLKQAVRAGRSRDYHAAVEILKSIVIGTDSFPEALLYLGRSYHALGEYHKAIDMFSFFLKQKPGSIAGRFFLGRTYLSLGLFSQAVHQLKTVTARRPRFVPAQTLIGLAFLKLKRPDIALQYFERAVTLEPENKRIYTAYLNTLLVQAVRLFYRGEFDLARQMLSFLQENGNTNAVTHLYLASIYKEFADYEAALHHYSEAIRLSPHDTLLKYQRASLLLRMGKRNEALNEISKTPEGVQFDPSFLFKDPLSLERYIAFKFLKEGQFRNAVHYGTKVLKTNPSDIDAHMVVGEAYRNLGEFQKAESHLNRVLHIQKSHIEARYGLTILYWEQGNYESALEELKQIRSQSPDHEIPDYYEALCSSKLNMPAEQTIPLVQAQLRIHGADPFLMTALGHEYLKSSQPQHAEKWFVKTLAVSANNRDALSGLIRVYDALGKKDDTSAAYERYLEIAPEDEECRKRYITFLIELKSYENACRHILISLSKDRKSKKLHRLLALCYRNTGKFREAMIIYKELLRGNPSSEEYLRAYVYCLDKSGDLKRARIFLEKALDHFKDSVMLLLILGVFYYREHDEEKALGMFRKVLDLDPKNHQAYKNMGLIYKRKGMPVFAEKFLARSEQYKQEAELKK